MLEWLVLPFSILALIVGTHIFVQLIQLFSFIATRTVFSVIGTLFGFTLAFLLDIKFVALAAGFSAYVFSVEEGLWVYCTAALSFYLFVVCSANIVILLVENLAKTKWGHNLRVLKPFRYDFDSLSKINEGLPDVLRMGIAFFGGAGLFIAFGILVFIYSYWFPTTMFPGQIKEALTLGESFRFALQSWVDVIPVISTAAEEQLSQLKPSWDTWASRGMMFILLAFQFMIYPAIYNFIVKLWEISHSNNP